MKPALVWCVWYRGKGTRGPWKLLNSETTRGEADYFIQKQKLYGDGLWIYRITRHEVEGPR